MLPKLRCMTFELIGSLRFFVSTTAKTRSCTDIDVKMTVDDESESELSAICGLSSDTRKLFRVW